MTLTPDEEKALEELTWELTSPHTLEEIAERMGCSRFAVARAEKAALAKLKKLLEGTDWRDGLEEPGSLGRSTRFTDLGSDGMTPNREEEQR